MKHPKGKKAVKIDRAKYEIVKDAILKCLKGKELTHKELFIEVTKRIKEFSGSLHWYLEWVKLDLEGRKIIKRLGGRPEKYALG